MRELEVGQNVFLLRFLPDGARLLLGLLDADRRVTFEVLSISTGGRVRLTVPDATIDSWWYDAWYGNPVAVHPAGETCHIAWAGRLHAFRTADGKSLPVPKGVAADQVVLSPDGTRLLTGLRARQNGEVVAVQTGPRGGTVLWRAPGQGRAGQLAGFLPDGERYVTVETRVRVRSFATGEELAAGRHKPMAAQQPAISADGRLLGAIGYGNMYFWDLTTLDRPRKIGGTSNFGDFRSFAFHPGGKTVAVIHGGPTLVKVYDLATLTLAHKWNWNLGPLRSVAYSPDGSLAAAGSEDGRIVVWDVDE